MGLAKRLTVILAALTSSVNFATANPIHLAAMDAIAAVNATMPSNNATITSRSTSNNILPIWIPSHGQSRPEHEVGCLTRPNGNWYIGITGVPEADIPGWCQGLWDNLHGRSCTVRMERHPYCGSAAGTINGICVGKDSLFWYIPSGGVICKDHQVERAFFRGTEGGKFGNITCEESEKDMPWVIERKRCKD